MTTYKIKPEGDVLQVGFSKPNLKIVAIIYSDYNGVEDYIKLETPFLKGSVHHLEQGEDVSTRPIVLVLVGRLVQMSSVYSYLAPGNLNVNSLTKC